MEMENKKDEAFRLLLEEVNHTTEELYDLRQREIVLLQKLLDAEKKVTFLCGELAKEKYKKEPEEEKPKDA